MEQERDDTSLGEVFVGEVAAQGKADFPGFTVSLAVIARFGGGWRDPQEYTAR